MTEKNAYFDQGEDKPSLTQIEINQLVQHVENGFRLAKSHLLTDRSKIISGLRAAIDTGIPLSSAVIGEVSILLESAKEGADILSSHGYHKIAFATQKAIEGGMFLIGVIGIGEAYALGNQENKLGYIFDQIVEERQTLSNHQIPLPEQAEEYLDMERRGKELGARYSEDPSGFAIINRIIKELQNPSSDLRTSIPIELSPQDFALCGIRETADFYKKVYLLGYRANLGPKPKT